jgi:hypothetical protein
VEGKRVTQPFRLKFTTTGLVPDAQYEDNARVNIQSGVPMITLTEAHDRPLAVVGGGPSAARALPVLQEWPGDIWAVNQGASWLSHVAAKARVWMFTVDPDPVLAEPIWTTGVQRAILGVTVAPVLLNYFRDNGKDVRLFNPHEAPTNPETLEGDETLAGGPSSVCRTFVPAACMGYKSVTYFGCEGSLEGRFDADGMFEAHTHAYRRETRPRQMIVRCGDKDFVTTPDLYLSTIALARFLREYPNVKEQSGGLLRGMLEHYDTWSVVAVSDAMRNVLQTDPERWGREKLARVAA